VHLQQLQDQIAATFIERDRTRGLDRTFMWLVEEVGELARELRSEDRDEEALRLEISDVLAWLVSVANLVEVDIEAACQRFAEGCPKCGVSPCRCPPR